jgi:hypothetical protein
MRDRTQCAPWGITLRARILALLLLVLVAFPVALPSTPSALAATGDAIFHDTSATASFPEWIAFQLDVESSATITTVELFWTAAGTPTLSIAEPTITASPRVQLVHEIDMTIHYLPPGVDIIYFWRVTDDRGDVSESERKTLFYMDERYDWRTQSDGPVTLYWYTGNDAFALVILGSASRTLDQLESRFGVVSTQPMRIVIYGNERDFNRSLPPNSAEWIGGQAYPELNLIFAVITPGSGDAQEIRRMIPHEVSHLALNQATANPYNSPPNWLDEGLAVYNQEAVESRFEQILERAVRDGRLIPVRALNSSFPLDPDQALLSYAESWSIVTYIIEEFGDQAMADLIAVFREDASYDDAVERSLGITIDELDAGWKTWLAYPGDQPGTDRPSNPASEDEDDEVSFTPTEKAITLTISGLGALGGLGLGIYSIVRVRRLRAPR